MSGPDSTLFGFVGSQDEGSQGGLPSPCTSVAREKILPIRLEFQTPGRATAAHPAPKSSRLVVKVKSRYLSSSKQRPVVSCNRTPRRQSLAKTPTVTKRPARSLFKSKTPPVDTSKSITATGKTVPRNGGKTPLMSKSASVGAIKTPSLAKSRKSPDRQRDSRSALIGSTTASAAAKEKVNPRPHLIRKAQALANTITQVAYARALLERNACRSEKRFQDWISMVAAAIDVSMKATTNIRLSLQKKQVYRAVDDILSCNDVLADTLSKLRIASDHNECLATALDRCSMQLPASGVCWDTDSGLLTSLRACLQALERVMPQMDKSAESFAALAQALDELAKVILEQDSGMTKAESLVSILASVENVERSLRIHFIQLVQPDIVTGV